MKRLLSLFFIVFSTFVQGQIELPQPDQEQLDRLQNLGNVASVLLDTVITFLPNNNIQVSAENAESINLYFEKFRLVPGSKLSIFDQNHKFVFEYTEQSNSDGGAFAIPPVKGEKIVLEYSGDPFHSEIVISQVGYFFKKNEDVQNSGFCQVDINCSEGNQWQDEKKGIVRLLLKKSSTTVYCSGSLMNNTAQDCRPYILSADHCIAGVSESGLEQSIALINYENKNCNADVSQSDVALTGLKKRASSNFSGGSDFLLLELNEDIPSEYEVYYNGWEMVEDTFNSGVSIHHPKGDVKKISTYSTMLVTPNVDDLLNSAYWEVIWQETNNGHGVTETGSSGAPIFNQRHLVVGYLSVGLSFCTKPNEPDYYGKLSYAWEESPDSSKRLDVWLDPINTNQTTLMGSYYPCNDSIPKSEREFIQNDFQVRFSEHKLHVTMFQNHAKQMVIELINLEGKTIVSKRFNSKVIDEYLDLTKLSQGLYFLKITENNRQRIERFAVFN